MAILGDGDHTKSTRAREYGVLQHFIMIFLKTRSLANCHEQGSIVIWVHRRRSDATGLRCENWGGNQSSSVQPDANDKTDRKEEQEI